MNKSKMTGGEMYMGPQFHETPYGKMFFEVQLPNLIKAINRLAEAVEKQNKLKEEEVRSEGGNLSNNSGA